MRFATFVDPAQLYDPRVGVVDDERIHPLTVTLTMLELVELGLAQALELGAQALEHLGIALEDVHILAPLQPPSVRDFVTFAEHIEGVRRAIDGAREVPDAWYDAPTFYFTNPHSILGPDDDVPFPAHSEARDFELEVAVIVGQAGRSLTLGEAVDHIFGYTILNDWSARDLQSREMQVTLGPAKGKDFATSLGPWIVTADEVETARDSEGFLDLWCAASVNGVEVGRDLLSNMGWTFEAMLAYASRDSAMVPGDLLGSGTVGNGGCLAELWGRSGERTPPPLRDGDIVTLEVQHLGTLRNRVSSGAAAPPIPGPRRRVPEQARSGHAHSVNAR